MTEQEGIDPLVAEIDRLRKALIETGRHIGAGLADTVSTDFLMLLPEEARLKMASQSERIARLLKLSSSYFTKSCDAEARLADALAALEPFIGEKLPSNRRTKIGYDRHGLRRCISPFELAQVAALATLSRLTEEQKGGE